MTENPVRAGRKIYLKTDVLSAARQRIWSWRVWDGVTNGQHRSWKWTGMRC